MRCRQCNRVIALSRKSRCVAASLRLYYKDMQWHDGTLARYCTTQLIISGNTAIPQIELFIDADCSIRTQT